MPRVICPNGHRLQIKDAHMGQVVRCPGCQASFVATVTDDGNDGGFPMGGYADPAARAGGAFSLRSLVNLLVGKPLLFVGLLLVLLGRGGDAVGLRAVARTQAQYREAQQNFTNTWDGKARALERQMREVQRELNTAKDQTELRKKQTELQDKQRDLTVERQKEQDRLEEATWKNLREAADAAANNHQMMIYWYEWAFMIGTLVLMLGLLVLGFTGHGAERWICYIMIAIITFSIYVGGAAWIESIASSFRTTDGPPAVKTGGTFR